MSSSAPTHATIGDAGTAAPLGRFVVEADVAGDERQAELARRARQPVDRRDERAEMLGIARIAEVQTIGEPDRSRADRDDVAHRFEDRVLGRVAGSIAP